MSKTTLFLDVDTGIDDAMAIAYAVLHPDIDLLAISTVAGNVDVVQTTRNTLAVLDIVGASEIPVHQGASRPLVRPHRDAAFVHGVNGLGGAEMPSSARPLGADRGPAALIRHAMARPGEITLACVGPLTNLAIALNVLPSLPSLLKRLVIMGGAYDVPGNITPHAEFNFFCDPEAAEQVLATAFAETIAIGLDVSHQVWLPRTSWGRLADAKSGAPWLVHQILGRSFETLVRPHVYLHDPLAVAVAHDPSLVRTKEMAIKLHAGADERGAVSMAPVAPVDVATEVDSRRFIDSFASTLGITITASDRMSQESV